MNIKAHLAAAVAATALTVGAAQASTISVSAFDIGAWNTATAALGAIEDFETTGPANGEGKLPGVLATSVGTFDTVGGIGSGSTCVATGGAPCTTLSLFGPTLNGLNGQGNLVPDNGEWSLNADDTLGVVWNVALASGGAFNKIVFGLRDIADIPGTIATVSSDGATPVEFTGLLNANKQLIVISFGTAVTSATVTIQNLNGVVNDSFSLDGAAVGVVPLPAAGFLLLGGLGALAAVRRRKQNA
ncbi:VPLPA-CTERM sorting domain-containing protein [Rhodovulum steppense]|uniref:Putative secreted protein n=1 Tax=Rhodovulum steppense TaxID=540251 RepID=A0A4R1YHW8_9RHOB|nr:VPLPA-CTERM sorting domain-containing protein [Rhodovulum steppense]TCM75884.1 putative secreted protein [Rhodovulum steppense]